MKNTVKRFIIYLVIISIVLLSMFIIYIYPFAKGVRRDAIEQKHQVKRDSILIINKDSLN